MAGFYVKRGDKEQGPFSSSDLKEFAESGKLRKTDKIRKEDSQKYYPAESVKGLFAKSSSAKQAPAKKRKPSKQVEEIYGGAELVEESADGFDYADDFNDEDDFDEYGEDEDFEPEPARKRRPRSPAGPRPARGQKSSRKGSAANKPAKKRKAAKKSAEGEEDEEEDGPWMNMFYGVCCIAGGIFLFIALGQGSPDDWGRKGGLVKLIVQLLYYVGGRWAVLVLLTLGGLLLIGTGIKQLREK
jgi:hypothetical protein